ncbi:helix-turn-helix domain-containing protein [Mucilaginibacter sp. OK098]|uniref:helix-turn-helix domain-containing protein n=1 Tax=Mucilaginibacter sp. OK098 TaxID=1855297 RepID=UPI0011610EB2|nr:helix-turn-helix domain-containing protein [Mucilaginibacter sp. OK098]
MSDILACFLFIAYLYFSLSLIINRYGKNPLVLKNEKKIGWAKKFMLASTLIAVTWLMYIIWVIVLNGKLVLGMMPYYPIYLIFGFCIYSIGIAGYYKPEIGLLKIPVNERNELLTKGEVKNNKEIILKAMATHCYYTDENINIQKLSKKIGINVKELSYIINVGFGKNFSDFINEFRITDFKQRLEDPKNIKYNLLGLAYEVGFNSKASFYRAFKKATHKTPAEFYKQQYKSI